MLLDRAERDAVELGFSEVRLYTNEAMTENLSFYPRHGYRETGRAVQDGFRRVYFSKTVGNDDVGDLPDGDRRDHLESGGLPQLVVPDTNNGPPSASRAAMRSSRHSRSPSTVSW